MAQMKGFSMYLMHLNMPSHGNSDPCLKTTISVSDSCSAAKLLKVTYRLYLGVSMFPMVPDGSNERFLNILNVFKHANMWRFRTVHEKCDFCYKLY